jgi:hypothetical protein
VHIEFPHCFPSAPRDPIKYLKRYKMEEIANLLWIGYILAEHGPVEFQNLWTLLRQAATHYIYGLNASLEDIEKAACDIRAYAIEMERLVISREVRL